VKARFLRAGRGAGWILAGSGVGVDYAPHAGFVKGARKCAMAGLAYMGKP